MFCITIHAPIITSMAVSMSAFSIGRSSTNSIAAPTAQPTYGNHERKEEVDAEGKLREKHRVGAKRVKLTMGEIDHPHDAEDQGQADAEESVGAPEDDGVDEVLEELIHGCSFPATGRRGAGARRNLSKPGNRALPASRSAPGGGVSLPVRQDDLAVLDLDQIDAGIALTAFLTGRARLVELDHAVHAGELDLPERRADRLGLGLAGLGDGGRDGPDAVIAAEAFGQPANG